MKSTTNGKTIEETFAGGTAAGAENTSAKIGTIIGTFEDALASAGEKMLNGLNPALDWLIEKSEGAANALSGALEWAGSALSSTFTNVQAALQPYMPLLSTLGNVVGTTVTTAFNVVGSVLNSLVLPAIKIFGEALSPAITAVKVQLEAAGNLIESLGNAVNAAVDAIGNAASSAWDKISGFGSSLWDKITSIGEHATGAMAFGGVTQINENMKGELIRLPNGSRIYPYETTRKLLQNEFRAASGNTVSNVFNVNIDARGSNMTRQEQNRLRREIVRDLIDAFDNVVPA